MSTGETIALVAAAVVATASLIRRPNRLRRSRPNRLRRIHHAKYCCFHGIFSRHDEHCPKCLNPGKPIELVKARLAREANAMEGQQKAGSPDRSTKKAK